MSTLRSVEMSLVAMDMEIMGYDKAVAEVKKWETMWPDHCKKCKGWGVIRYWDDPSPAGVSLSPGKMEYTDPCECIENGKCPRCGSDLVFQSQSDRRFSEDFDADPLCKQCCWTEETEGCAELPDAPEEDDYAFPEPQYNDYLLNVESVESLFARLAYEGV